NNWHFTYEQTFTHYKEDIYRLTLGDGRVFEFQKVQDNDKTYFIDQGDLGVEILQLANNHFKVKYFQENTYTFLDDQLIRVEDSNNNYIALEYNKNNQIKNITNSEGTTLTFYYNHLNVVECVQDEKKRQWEFYYDKYKNLITTINPKQTPTHYSYTPYVENETDISYLLTTIQDHQETPLLEVTYDDKARVSGYTQGEESFTYEYITPTMIKKEDNNGDALFYGLDSTGQIQAITHTDGSESSQTYDKDKLLATITDKGGNTTYKYFDEKHRIIKEIDQENKETLYEYEGSNPNPIAILSTNNEQRYTYDTNHNLIEINNNGTIQQFAYDAKGNLVKTTDAKGNTTQIAYDENSRPIKYTDAKGAQTTLSYNPNKRQESITDPNGNTTINTYDIVDNIIQTTQEDHILKYTYDKENNLIAITDPLGNTTQYIYDRYNRVVKQLLPNGKEKNFIYNSDNTIKTYIQEDNTQIHYSYNKDKKITSIKTDDEILNYEYDSLGNIINANSNDSNIEFIYDSNANIIHQSQNDIEINKAYDTNSNKLTNLILFEKNFIFQRDEKDKLSKIQTPHGDIELAYDDNSILVNRKYPNTQEENISYDENYNTTKIQTADTTLNYQYNDLNQIVKKDDTEFTYDHLNRIIKTPTKEFTYDLAGNILTQESLYDTAEYKLLKNETYTFTYDQRGNLKEKYNKLTNEKTHYTFNLKNQLIKRVKYSANQEIIETLNFTYDPLGRRVSKTLNNETYHYIYDAQNIVAILDTNKNLLATILHDESIDQPLSITTYNQEHKKTQEYQELNLDGKYLLDTHNSKTYYYHRDHQGSIIALTNQEGEIVESFIYDESYGTILLHNKLTQTYNPYCYTAREFESDDLYYYRARYYDPTIQRFLSKDPIEFMSGDYNFYRYVSSDPMNRIDPSGLTCEKAAAFGGTLGSGLGFIVGGGLSAVCDVGTDGACVVVNPEIVTGSTALGGAGGIAVGKAGCEATNWLMEKTKELAESILNTGTKVKGKEKEKSDCGEQKGYKDSQDNNYAETEDGIKMDRDHIPAKQYMIEKAKIVAKGMKKKFNPCIEKAIIDEALTIMIPKKMHGMGYSYGQSADTIKKSGDLSKSANDIAKRDVKSYRDLMDKDNPTNKKGKPLNAEEQKKMDDIPDDCKEKIEEGLKKMEKENYDQFLKDKINENQDC
uniref:RHS repeat-associated core domain-containing protein n=1 Tax=Sulfurimonas sp. TaxID=2022749 RepID=UPI003D13F37E